VGANLLDQKATHFTILLFLVIKSPRTSTLYRNYRKSSDAHCSQ